MTRNIWRRTAFTSASGDVEVAQDDWTLLRPSGEPLARLYKVTGRSQLKRRQSNESQRAMAAARYLSTDE